MFHHLNLQFNLMHKRHLLKMSETFREQTMPPCVCQSVPIRRLPENDFLFCSALWYLNIVLLNRGTALFRNVEKEAPLRGKKKNSHDLGSILFQRLHLWIFPPKFYRMYEKQLWTVFKTPTAFLFLFFPFPLLLWTIEGISPLPKSKDKMCVEGPKKAHAGNMLQCFRWTAL